ncbi:17-beta-hydroxysteroid dehydrogenase type 6-like [Hemicordylus capensis]|uniref:17-beta-hydroxysteroid dehydrogenase type 6-like n=1 Tax=Hemicordylus capensis TaxID=884348 RepID=UPI002303279A|nr:17-beta-hydroxysteroid dehydrogenase type 6-like [Hemicordylus capensis]
MWLYLATLVGLYFFRRWYRERQTVDKQTEKYVFITGCDTGLGNQLARQLDLKGLRVLAACFTEKGAEQLEKASSQRLKTILLDITSPDSVAKATQWVKEQVRSKGLWGLVNSAGIAIPIAPNEWLTKDDFWSVLEVNLLRTINVTLHMLPLVRKALGRIVTVTSAGGRKAFSRGGYSPSKFGLEAFSDSLRRELCIFVVKVSIVEPGFFNTGMNKREKEVMQSLWGKLPIETKAIYGQQYWDTFIKNFAHDFHLATDCMEHALTSCYPRSRYSASWDAKFVISFSYLPASLVDYLVALGQPKLAQTVF